MSIFMPEILIRFYLLKTINEIKTNLDFFSNLIFGDEMQVGDFNVKQEFKNIFSTELPFKIKFGINIATTELPSVHIYLPKEDVFFTGIGSSPELDFDEVNDEVIEENEIHFQTQYSILIADDNADKVLILYHVLKYMFYRYSHQLELDGFENLKISGNELQMQSNLIPASIFARNLNLSFTYLFETRNSIVQKAGGKLVVDREFNMKKPS